jgi:hypothetical protein
VKVRITFVSLIAPFICLLACLGNTQWQDWRGIGASKGVPLPPAENFKSRPYGEETGLKLVSQASPPTSEQLDAARRYSELHGGQAMVVMWDGKVIFESYANGGGKDRLQPLASGTKSFVGVVAVAAVQDGLIRLDEKACESLTEWKTDPLKSQITYRHLLTMTSGLTPGRASECDPLARLERNCGKADGWQTGRAISLRSISSLRLCRGTSTTAQK